MRIEIDQSGKIENTSKHTYLAFSNSQHFVLEIKATEKRKLQKYFRSIGKSRIFIYLTFAALLIILLKNRKIKTAQLIVDIEYQGRTQLIKDSLHAINPDFPVKNLSFHHIGKKSSAHYYAYGAAIGSIKSDLKVGASEIFRTIKKPGSA